MPRLCIQWPRFGPYHLARLTATAARLHAQGVDVIGLETAAADATYAWAQEKAATGFDRVTVFPDQTFDTLTPQTIHTGVTQTLDRLQPDAVGINSYSLPDARAALMWCRQNRRVAVVMTDSKADDAERTGWREHIKSILLSQFDAALVAGTPQRAYLEALGFAPDRLFTGYDVVDNAHFQRGAEVARAAYTGPPAFIAVNRFIPLKNLDRLLTAYYAYRQQVAAPWDLVLAGDGPERPALVAQISRTGIEGVSLPGFLQYDALPAAYGRAKALIHPALKDTWGLVVNEAMAAGLPVLVSERAGCAADLVRPGETGFTFDPEDPAALTALMVRLTDGTVDVNAMGRQAQVLIAAWSPTRFADNLWNAVEAGQGVSDRPLALPAQVILHTLRLLSRSVDAFHSADV